ncbi:uncharacterized protein [Chironomus tepperi]|uniref:uncharacterized protein n=1 Tax=Chironomus tepperi TaxID=113505 RepID=UPI00391EF9FA
MSDIFDLNKNIPSYLNEEYFRSIFTDKSQEILNFKIEGASKPGDNFVGAVYRITITTSTDRHQFIAKAPSTSGHETLHSYLSNDFVGDLFKCEIKVYEEVLPEILKIWSQAGYDDVLCPRLIHQSLEPHPTIILEDLSPKGYETLQKPIDDFEASLKVVKRLAKFHAASYFLAYEKNQDFSNYNQSVFDNQILTRVIYDMGLEGFTDVASTKPALRKYVEKLRKFHSEFRHRVGDSYRPSQDGINVLCHNDFHLKNLLFKCDGSGGIEDFCMIDYQLCNFTSPAIDLIFALYYFVSATNRRHRRDDFISAYYNQFSTSLNDFKFTKSIPTRQMLDNEINKCGPFEICTAICLTIFCYFDMKTLNSEDLDMGEGTMKAKYRMYENEDFLEMIEWQLDEFVGRGVL